METIAVIDYGMGNLHSASKALERVAGDARVLVTSDPGQVLKADRVVFPGVGAIRDCMGELGRLGLAEAIRECAENKPLLAICVGMQAMMDFSEENDGTPCLGILPGRVRRFESRLLDAGGEHIKIPHMGWNQVNQCRAHPLWRDIADGSRFYFVHSYYVEAAEPQLTAATTDYGIAFTSVAARENVFAVQFHPEKSQRAGLQLLANFVRWDGHVK